MKSRSSRGEGLWRGWLLPLLVVGAVVGSFRSAVADWNDVPSGSMLPTIVEGDRIFVNKLAYDLRVPFSSIRLARWADPERGDIVVFFSPVDGTRLVKRVVGLPGDQISMRDNRVIINGVAVSVVAGSGNGVWVEALGGKLHDIRLDPRVPALRSFDPQRIPSGHYFMLGDNRDHSADSRYFGFVPRDNIVGQAEAVVVSFNRDRFFLPRAERLLLPLL